MSIFRRVVALAIVAACAGSTGPGNGSNQGIHVGQAVGVTLAPADSFLDFLFRPATDSVYSVEVVPAAGVVNVLVLDSLYQLLNAFTTAGASTPPGDRWTQTFAGPASNPWLIRVESAAPGQAAAATITVHQVATGPEHVGSAITLDSVLDGESLDTYDDVDRFTFNDTTGAKIQIFVQATAAADSSQQVCMVLDTLTPKALALTVSTAGDTVLEGSAQVQLPRTGKYRIDVTSSRNGCRDGFGANETYLGPYRLLVKTFP